VVVYTCNSSTQKAETGGLWVQGQPGLHSKTLSQKTEQHKQQKPKPNQTKTKNKLKPACGFVKTLTHGENTLHPHSVCILLRGP
jgi:hypothetical protein